jgi:hypothetical protein
MKIDHSTWMGHPIVRPDDAHHLEQQAAILEFHHGLPRHEAEAQALAHYRADQHAKAAAHHLAGLKAAHAAGDLEVAKQHHARYVAHAQQLGVDPSGEPDPRIMQHMSGPDQKVYNFRHHGADQFLVESKPEDKQNVTKKSELDVHQLAKRLVTLGLLLKGDVVGQIGNSKIQEDHSHRLPEEARNQGYSLHLEHSGQKHDGFMRAWIAHGGRSTGLSAWAYPNLKGGAVTAHRNDGADPSAPIVGARRLLHHLDAALQDRNDRYVQKWYQDRNMVHPQDVEGHRAKAMEVLTGNAEYEPYQPAKARNTKMDARRPGPKTHDEIMGEFHAMTPQDRKAWYEKYHFATKYGLIKRPEQRRQLALQHVMQKLGELP